MTRGCCAAIPDQVAGLYFFGLPVVTGIVGLILGVRKRRTGIGVLALLLTPIAILFALGAKDRSAEPPAAGGA